MFEAGRYRLICGDAMSVMRAMPDRSVDLIVADPPYKETSLHWDRSVNGWLQEGLRVLKPSGSLWMFSSMKHLLGIDLEGWKHIQEIVWEKHNGSSSFADRIRRVHEFLVHFAPQAAKWGDIYHSPVYTLDAVAKAVRTKRRLAHWGDIGYKPFVSHDGGPRLLRSVVYCRSEHGRARHPTQKPVLLPEICIRHSCPPGGVVLDPFMGSGTTGVAAMRCGRRFIGIEKSQAFVDVASERIESNQATPTPFSYRQRDARNEQSARSTTSKRTRGNRPEAHP